MFRTLLRVVLLIIIVAAVAAFFFGYRMANRDDARNAERRRHSGEQRWTSRRHATPVRKSPRR